MTRPADRDPKAVRDSLVANSAKRKEDPFSGRTGELYAAHAGTRLTNEEPPLEGPGLLQAISSAIDSLDLDNPDQGRIC